MLLLSLFCVSFNLLLLSVISFQYEKIKFYKNYLADQQKRANLAEKSSKELQEQVASLAIKLALSNVQSVPLSRVRVVSRQERESC